VKRRRRGTSRRRPATVKSTGGGGFSFADKVGAYFLAEILRAGRPLGSDSGIAAELHFETKESGWLLDDLLLVVRKDGLVSRCALSVKSNSRFTSAGLDGDFVTSAWDQWRGKGRPDFDRETDFLGLATVPTSKSVEQQWNDLTKQASETNPARMALRLRQRSQFSAQKLRMFESLRKARPGHRKAKPDAVETARLLSRIRVFHFDFESVTSRDEENAIAMCTQMARSGTSGEGRDLWQRLVGLAASARTTGGSFDLNKLVHSLRGTVELHDFPDHHADWRAISERARANLAEIRTVFGEGIHIERVEERSMLTSAMEKCQCVALVGESGSGKSAVVVDFVVREGASGRLLWLNAQQLSQPSQPDLARSIGLRHTIEDLVRSSDRQDCILVLDAFEQLGGEARARALELSRIVTDHGSGQWKILLTVQPDAWIDMRRALLDAGIKKVDRRDFGPPKSTEVFGKLATAPGVARLFQRPELRPILCNLATLNWVVQADRERRLVSDRAWIGETELIDWIWKQWLGKSTDKHLRDAVLRQLGETEGERISGAVPLDSIDDGQLNAVGVLEKARILRVTESALKFSHDLAADWARLRSLVVSGDVAATRIRQKAGTPRWSRAIRLYAQRLVERDEGLSGWKAFVAGMSGDSPDDKIASDLFLDGILFAANAESLLEHIWGDLIADSADTLRRLLRRIVRVGTVPDFRFQEEMPAEDADLAAVWFRIPNPLYWMPFLRTMAQHAEDIAREGVFEAATVCELWLRIMPLDFPGRKEAAKVALGIAREVQGRRAEGMTFVRNADRMQYEALLYAAPEYPAEVSQTALELCGRLAESEAVRERAIRAQQERARKFQEEAKQRSPEQRRRAMHPQFLPTSWGPLVRAGTDGPLKRVPEGFRSAVLDTTALTGLAIVRPEIAREVLLAVCLSEPKRESEYRAEHFSLPGFAYWPDGSPPMYWKGAFYRLLQLTPDEGLDAVLRLVNFATERWLEKGLNRLPSDDDRQKWSLQFSSDRGTVRWVGNANVFAWHRDDPTIPDIVVCALMALEKWLYDKIERGEPIEHAVNTIYQRGSSLAFGGVLVTVGTKKSDLFSSTLQPLLGNLALYECQLHVSFQESHNLWAIGMVQWARLGNKAYQIAQDWHQMPHRKQTLIDTAIGLMLSDEPTKQYLAARRKDWETLVDSLGAEGERLKFVLAQLDPSNYASTKLPDGQIQFQYRLPPQLELRAREIQEKQALTTITLQLPELARRHIRENRALPDNQLDHFLRTIQQLANKARDANEEPFIASRRTQAVAGGLALLVVQHRAWLLGNPAAREWCLSTLRTLATAPLDASYSPHDASDTSAEGFIGEAGVALLPDTQEVWVKRAALTGATGFYYRSTFHTLSTACRLREQLGPEFTRLQNAALLWAALRRSAPLSINVSGETRALSNCREAIFRRYVEGRVGDVAMTLRRAAILGQRLLRRAERKTPWYREGAAMRDHENGELHRVDSGLDLEVVRQAYGFLDEISSLSSRSTRPGLTDIASELLELELSMLPKLTNQDVRAEVRGPLMEFDLWVFGHIVRAILNANSPLEARRYWEPVLELPPGAHEWVRQFFTEWFRVGLEAGDSTFETTWKAMVSHVLSSEVWSPSRKYGWFHIHNVVAEMMGIRWAKAVLGQGKYASLVKAMAPIYDQWTRMWVGYADLASSYAYFLSTESGSTLLPSGMRHLSAHVDSFSDHEWEQEHLTDALSAAVRTCWKKYEKHIRSDPGFWKAFVTVLNALCARNDALALAIRSEVIRETN